MPLLDVEPENWQIVILIIFLIKYLWMFPKNISVVLKGVVAQYQAALGREFTPQKELKLVQGRP